MNKMSIVFMYKKSVGFSAYFTILRSMVCGINVGLSIILDTIIKKFDRRKPFEGTHRTVVCST